MMEWPANVRRMPAALILGSALLAALACGCGERTARNAAPAADEFSFMTYNLSLYGLTDRDGDGQNDDPKPDAERKAVIDTIAAVRPDVLAVQEIGDAAAYNEFRFALQAAGLSYPHEEYLQRGRSELNLAVLSRFPIVARTPHIDDRYSIGEAEIAVLRGFIDVEIEVTPSYRFRLLTAHLKSKVFHRLGQTEMRRNEARLLNKHVRRILKDNPDANVLVAGDMNDTFQSAALREVTGERGAYLVDTRPADEVGAVWTHFDPDLDSYARIDYVLVSHGMEPEWVRAKTRVVSGKRKASDHRPVLAVFRSVDAKPAAEATPDAD